MKILSMCLGVVSIFTSAVALTDSDDSLVLVQRRANAQFALTGGANETMLKQAASSPTILQVQSAGQRATCPTGTVATGCSCGSGCGSWDIEGQDVCHCQCGEWTRAVCTSLQYTSQQVLRQGRSATCPVGHSVTACSCGSGCGSWNIVGSNECQCQCGEWTRAVCANTDMDVQPVSAQGSHAECPSQSTNFALSCACGSGCGSWDIVSTHTCHCQCGEWTAAVCSDLTPPTPSPTAPPTPVTPTPEEDSNEDEGRETVPDGKACRQLEDFGIIPSCTSCNAYRTGDPNPLLEHENGYCVYVPSENKCMADRWARANGSVTITDCQDTAWPQYGEDNSKCVSLGDEFSEPISQSECQTRAAKAGHGYYQYTTEGGGQCATTPTCDKPTTGTGYDWKIFKKAATTSAATPDDVEGVVKPYGSCNADSRSPTTAGMTCLKSADKIDLKCSNGKCVGGAGKNAKCRSGKFTGKTHKGEFVCKSGLRCAGYIDGKQWGKCVN